MKPFIFSILALAMATTTLAQNISFDDLRVKYYCVRNWDANGDGELSMEEAASVKSLGIDFIGEEIIESFNELQYFTGLTTIEENTFYGCKGLKYITIPEGITSIGKNAFYDCSALTTISFPTTITTIGDYAFCGCWSIDNIILPEGVTSIGEFSFTNCSNCNSIFIPSTLTTIGAASFWNCPNITSVIVDPDNAVFDSRNDCDAIIQTAKKTLIFGCQSTLIPSSIKKIGKAAFLGCSKLTGIVIPKKITEIGTSAFTDCSELSAIDIPASVKTIGQGAFANCTSLSDVRLHEGLTTIGIEAFQSCMALNKISIPESVTKLQTGAFRRCDNLTKVDVNIGTPLTIDGSVFSSRRNATLYVPAGARPSYKKASIWTDFKNIVEKTGEHVSLSLSKDSILPIGNTNFTVALTNDDFNTFDGFQFDFSLPEGFALGMEEDEVLYTQPERFGGTSVTMHVRQHDDGHYHLSCLAPAGVTITGKQGDVLTLPIIGNGETMPGEYEVIMQNVTLHTTDDIDISLEDASCMLHVKDYAMGDVNHDGTVSIADVTATVNKVLGHNNSRPFFFENADIDHDNYLGVSDVMGIVGIVLGVYDN